MQGVGPWGTCRNWAGPALLVQVRSRSRELRASGFPESGTRPHAAHTPLTLPPQPHWESDSGAGPIYRCRPGEVKNVAQGCWSKVPVRSVPFSYTLHDGWKEHQALELSPGSPGPAGVLGGTPAVQCTSGPAMPPSRCQSSPHRSPCNRRVLCTREPQKLDHKSKSRGLVEEGEGGCGGATQRRDSAAKACGAHAHAETPGDGCQHEEIKVSDKQINHLKGFIEGRN